MPRQNGPTLKQLSLIENLLAGMSQRDAQRAAGYSGTSAVQGKHVRNALIRLKRKRTASADRLLREVSALAVTDRTGIYSDDWQLKPKSEWTLEQRACFEGAETIVKNARAGDGHMDTVLKLKLASKTEAMKILATYHGLLAEKIEHTGNITVSWQAPEPAKELAQIVSNEAIEEPNRT